MNSEIRILLVQDRSEIDEIASLAHEIWHEHYGKLLSPGQIDYMIEKFQSVPAITKAIAEDDYTYYIIRDGEEAVGYAAARPSEDGSLFLSKLYILAGHRGRKISRLVLAMLKKRCLAEGLPSIWLTVNRGNLSSIAAYKKLGFVIEQEVDADIGHGYVMDDYIMRYVID